MGTGKCGQLPGRSRTGGWRLRAHRRAGCGSAAALPRPRRPPHGRRRAPAPRRRCPPPGTADGSDPAAGDHGQYQDRPRGPALGDRPCVLPGRPDLGAIALGAEAFADAWTAGGSCPLSEIVAEALQVAQARSPSVGQSGVDARGDGTFTRREREVLHLLAAGRADREIAAALFIGQGTVRSHLTNIYGKLDVGSRTAAVAAARRRASSDPNLSSSPAIWSITFRRGPSGIPLLIPTVSPMCRGSQRGQIVLPSPSKGLAGVVAAGESGLWAAVGHQGCRQDQPASGPAYNPRRRR